MRCPETFTGSSRAQTTPRGVAALAKTPGMSFGRRLARRRLDPAITPATFLDTALAVFQGQVRRGDEVAEAACADNGRAPPLPGCWKRADSGRGVAACRGAGAPGRRKNVMARVDARGLA